MNKALKAPGHTGATRDLGDVGDDLTIGALAVRTGLSAATLRMWEQRHGFPEPRRLDSGHRRYAESDVATVLKVRERQADGVRLGAAIAHVVRTGTGTDGPGSPSVYAELRVRHPQLAPQRLTKATLLALTWAIEDEFCSKARRPVLFGAFQRERYFQQSDERWQELARTARSTYVFGDFAEAPARADDDTDTGTTRLVTVDLPPEAPLSREWAVICDAAELPVALTAWELPGQSRVADKDRIFDAVWTLDPDAVRDAARVCADVCARLGAPDADDVVRALAEPAGPGADLPAITSMFNRVVGYMDRSR